MRPVSAAAPAVVLCASIAACGHATGGPVAAGCPVTLANASTPPGERPSPDDDGNGALWTLVPPTGTVVATPPFVRADGSMRIKFPWWGSRRVGARLTIAGSRLDRPSRPLAASIQPGLTGAPHFWASAITFPTEGCYRVTGTAGAASLTVVVRVVKARSA